MTRTLHVSDDRFPIGSRVRYTAEACRAFRAPRAGVVVGHPTDQTLIRVHWDFNTTGNTYVAVRYLEREAP